MGNFEIALNKNNIYDLVIKTPARLADRRGCGLSDRALEQFNFNIDAQFWQEAGHIFNNLWIAYGKKWLNN